MSDPEAPDLASILATLAQHSGLRARQGNEQSHTNTSFQQAFSTPRTQSQSTAPQSSPPQATALQNTALRSNPVDPSRITTWPAALRYTSSLLDNNADIAARVKKLIRSQHEHERSWWKGRQTLLVEREKRRQGRKAVNDVLRALGGRVVDEEGSREGGNGDGGDESVEDVFAEYDAKVYRAAVEMVADVRRQLKEMGIPGFVIRSEMVGQGQARVSKEEVRELEKRVLVLLEDLSKD